MNSNLIIKTKDYKISVNPFIECLGAIFVLADFGLNKARTNKKYIEKICSTFSKYINHDFVKKFSVLLQNPSFKFDAPVEMILTMFYQTTPSQDLLQRSGLTLDEYQKLHKDFLNFYQEINFDKFFRDNIDYYHKNAKQFQKDIEKYSPQEFLFDFLGLSSNNLNALLMFGVTTSNYGINIDNNLFCCVRPYKESRFEDEIDFCYDLPYMTTLLLHEFAHSFINPLTHKYAKKIDKMDDEIFSEIFKYNSYGTHKETAINETIIRTIECLYLKEYFKDGYIEIKEEYMRDGFSLIPQLEILFEEYLSNRTLYKNITEFYSKIIDFFDQK